MQNPQNFYSIKFSGANCTYSLLVNDVPVFHFYNKGILSTRFPINHLILKSGEQEVRVQVYPQGIDHLSTGSRFEVTIEESSGENYSINESIASHKTPVFNNKEKFYEYSFTFEAQVPYELNGWSTSEVLKYPEKTLPKIIAYYKYLHGILKNGKFDQFYELLEKKNEELDISLYSNSESSQREWMQVINELQRSEMKIADFPENTTAYYYGNGRVVSLFQENFRPILFFENKEKGLGYDLHLYLQKKQKEMLFEVIR